MKTELSKQAQGRWTSILSKLGIDSKYLKNRHGECPICKAGVNRFRFDNKEGKGTYYCNQCGAGDGVKLAMNYLGLSFKETAEEVRKIIGECRMTAINDTKPDTAKNESRINAIFAGLKRITSEDAAGLYLMLRGIKHPPVSGVAFHPSVAYWDQGDDGKPVKLGDYPALVGVVRNSENKVISLQINYLTNDGKLLLVPSPKKILPIISSMKGASIRLGNVDENTKSIAICEGVCTGLGWQQDNGGVVWCAINANNMPDIFIPEHIKNVYVIADNDKSFTGQAKAFELANRLVVKEKRTVKVVQILQILQSDTDSPLLHMEQPTGFDYFDYVAINAN